MKLLHITTLEELREEFENWTGTEREFNNQCLIGILVGHVSKDVFLEYLEITQGDISDSLDETFAEAANAE